MYVMGSRVGADDGGGELGDEEGDRLEEEGSGAKEGVGTIEGDGELGCGAGEVDVALTVMDNFWPLLQWSGKVHMKW